MAGTLLDRAVAAYVMANSQSHSNPPDAALTIDAAGFRFEGAEQALVLCRRQFAGTLLQPWWLGGMSSEQFSPHGFEPTASLSANGAKADNNSFRW